MSTPHDLFRQVLADTGDRIAAIRAIRHRFGLDTRQAKEVVLAADRDVAPPAGQGEGSTAELPRAKSAVSQPPGSKTPLLDEIQRSSRLPDGGLDIPDLTAALELLAVTPGVRDKRILSLRLHRGGVLYVRTGEASGGYRLVMQKQEGSWRVSEMARWTA